MEMDIKGPPPAYDQAVHGGVSRYYIENVPRSVDNNRHLNVNINLPGSDHEFNIRPKTKLFNVTFNDAGFVMHHGKDESAPEIATVRYIFKDNDLDANLDFAASEKINISAKDLKEAKKEQASSNDERVTFRLPLSGTRPSYHWGLVPRTRPVTSQLPETKSSSKDFLRNFELNFIDSTDTAVASFNSQFSQGPGTAAEDNSEEWGCLEFFEPLEQRITDQALVSLICILEMNVRLASKCHTRSDSTGKMLALLCSVM